MNEEEEAKLDEVLYHVDPRRGLKSLPPEEGVDSYLKKREGEVGDSTLETYERDLNAIVEFCRKQNITELKQLDGEALNELQVWIREEVPVRTDEYAPKRMRDYMYLVQSFIKHLETIEAVPEGLHKKVDIPELEKGDGVCEDFLDSERAQTIVDHLSTFEYASLDHVIWVLLAILGDRKSGIRSIDVKDCHPDEDDPYIELHHRPDQGTGLKNNDSSEREVSLPPWVADVISEYIDIKRNEVTDEYGREPLLTTSEGRIAPSTLTKYAYKWTRPCAISRECPHDKDIDDCKAASNTDHASKCPSTKSPHKVRKGYITAERKKGVPKGVLSERCDVSEAVLEEHYEFLTDEEERKIRQEILEEIRKKKGGYVAPQKDEKQ